MSPEHMDLRDLFAAFALPGTVAANPLANADDIAAQCYQYADALMDERMRSMPTRGNA